MADNAYLPGVVNLVTTVELAVRRSQALEASHLLRVPPAEGFGRRRPRHRSPLVVGAALLVLVSMVFWLGVQLLQRP